MRQTRLIMGMPITVEIVGALDTALHETAFDYFAEVDRRFSTYKSDSEISAINRLELDGFHLSSEMREVLILAALTKTETNGYFDIQRSDGALDPSGIVKGWAILNAAKLLKRAGADSFYVDAGGDIQCSGTNAAGEEWSAGIRHPFETDQIVKVLYPHGRGIATSGSYVRGDHIYNPHVQGATIADIVSLTVIGPDVLDADRFATAAFAMGREGIDFIEGLAGFEGYLIDADGIATMTSRLQDYMS